MISPVIRNVVPTEGLPSEEPSPGGLHAVEPKPEPDLSKKYAARPGEANGAERARALQILARNKGRLKKTALETGISTRVLQLWRDDALRGWGVAEPIEIAKSSSVRDTRRQLGVIVNTILANLPKRLATTTLQEQVRTIQAFVPLMTAIDQAMKAGERSVTPEQVKALAKKKLAEQKNAKDLAG